MKELMGRGVSGGIAIGKLYFFNNTPRDVPEYTVDNVDAELKRYRSSLVQAKNSFRMSMMMPAKGSQEKNLLFFRHIL